MPYSTLVSVLTAATNRKLTTVAAVAEELRIAEAAVTNGETLIAAASDAIEAVLGRTLATERVRQTFRYSAPMFPYEVAPRALLLDRRPVGTIEAIAADDTDLVVATDAEVAAEAGLLYRLWTNGLAYGWQGRTISVTYTGGYTLPGDTGTQPALPALIQRCATITAAAWFRDGAAGLGSNVRAEAVDGVGSTQYRDPQPEDLGLPPGVAALLAGRRNWRV